MPRAPLVAHFVPWTEQRRKLRWVALRSLGHSDGVTDGNDLDWTAINGGGGSQERGQQGKHLGWQEGWGSEGVKGARRGGLMVGLRVG